MTTGMHLVSTMLLATTIAGCAYQSKSVQPAVPGGASLQINQSYQALPNSSKLYFQGGNRIESGQLDRWTAYCELYVFNRNKQADYQTSVLPGRVEVIASKFDEEYVENQHIEKFQPIQLASWLWEGDGPPSYILYSTTMHLSASQQPDIKLLSCAQKASTYGDYHLTLAQIRQALGNLIQLNL